MKLFFDMWSKKKRAVMGIGTLIIFIATILVAAVAAGVLISTSGVLQQRALITGQEARKKITNAIEIIQILAYGNKTDETLNNFEVLIRLDAGSDPVQMKKFDISYIGPEHDATAYLQSPTMNDPNIDSNGFDNEISLPLMNGSLVSLKDLDGDGRGEKLYMHTVNGENTQHIIVNFTDKKVGDFVYTLVENVSYPYILNLSDIQIIGKDDMTYAYMNLNALLTSKLSINATNSSMFFSANPYGPCSFDNLPNEGKYCFIIMHGDDDEVLGDGEVFKILFKLRHEYRMSIGQEFNFIFSAEKGRLTSAQARTPDIIQTLRIVLWPIA
jgi:archaellin